MVLDYKMLEDAINRGLLNDRRMPEYLRELAKNGQFDDGIFDILRKQKGLFSSEITPPPQILKEGNIAVSGDCRIWRKKDGKVVDTGKKLRRLQYQIDGDWGIYLVNKNGIVLHMSHGVNRTILLNLFFCLVIFFAILSIGIYAFLRFIEQ